MKPCAAYGPIVHPARSPARTPYCSSRHSAPAAMFTLSVTAYDTSKFTLTSRCRFLPASNAVGDVGPSEALMVLWTKWSVRCIPSEALRSQSKPPGVKPRTPPTSDASAAVPPVCGVKPPGNSSWNVKQFGSSDTCCRATGSGTWSVTATVGQSAEPMPFAASTSPTSSVRPRSMLNTPRRVFGLRKKTP